MPSIPALAVSARQFVSGVVPLLKLRSVPAESTSWTERTRLASTESKRGELPWEPVATAPPIVGRRKPISA